MIWCCFTLLDLSSTHTHCVSTNCKPYDTHYGPDTVLSISPVLTHMSPMKLVPFLWSFPLSTCDYWDTERLSVLRLHSWWVTVLWIKPGWPGSKAHHTLHFLKCTHNPYLESVGTNPSLQIRKLRLSQVQITCLNISTGKAQKEDSTDFHHCPKGSLKHLCFVFVFGFRLADLYFVKYGY